MIAKHKTTRSLLLADDNEANRLIAKAILEREGFRVTPVANGAEAVQAVIIQSFDVVILDIVMPVMDGLRALRRIRKLKPKLTAIALTAYCNAADQQRYRVSGFDSVLSKPLRPMDVSRALDLYEAKAPPQSPQISIPKSYDALPLIDSSISSQLCEIGTSAYLALTQDKFWEAVEDCLRQMRTALPDTLRGDPSYIAQFRRAVHTIKGASATIGLCRVTAVARDLQNAPPSDINCLLRLLCQALKESRVPLADALSMVPGQLDASVQMRR